jgi:transposase
MVISAKSRIPIGAFVYAGNTNDATTLPDAMNVINNVVPKINQTGSVELVMDRIYITAKNVRLMRANEKIKIKWLGPLKSGLSEKRFQEKVSEAYEQGLWEKITYRSAKEIARNEKPCIESFETTWVMTDEIKPELLPGQKRRTSGSIEKIEEEVRCVVYKDNRRASQEKEIREKNRKRLDIMLVDFSQKINKRKLKELKACEERLDGYLRKFSDLRKCINYSLDIDKDEDKIKFEWNWIEDVYKEEDKYDGVFALLTEYAEEEKSKNELIGTYRERNEIEMNFRDLKGILELERLFLQDPNKIDAYIFLKILAYFVLTFLRWFLLKESNIKTTESNIQKALGNIDIIEGEFAPSGINFCDVAGDSELCKILRQKLDLSNPFMVIREVNEKSIQKFKGWVSKWYKNWLLEQKCVINNSQ